MLLLTAVNGLSRLLLLAIILYSLYQRINIFPILIDWVVQENTALTGTLLQKVNKILEKANLTIYTEQFENVVDLYIELKIMNHITDSSYSQLML